MNFDEKTVFPCVRSAAVFPHRIANVYHLLLLSKSGKCQHVAPAMYTQHVVSTLIVDHFMEFTTPCFLPKNNINIPKVRLHKVFAFVFETNVLQFGTEDMQWDAFCLDPYIMRPREIPCVCPPHSLPAVEHFPQNKIIL